MKYTQSSPLFLSLEPIAGSAIGSCYDRALEVARILNISVKFTFNGVNCMVLPFYFGMPEKREAFIARYHEQLGKK
jgi:hypothetical protein